MRNAILRDVKGKVIYNLTKLAEDNDEEISVGREGNGNNIELGLDLTISRSHATITYQDTGKFWIKDHSTNGTRINETLLKLEMGYLSDGDELWFGAYGPIIYEEIINSK